MKEFIGVIIYKDTAALIYDRTNASKSKVVFSEPIKINKIEDPSIQNCQLLSSVFQL
jgi:hypothetical protein